MVAGRGRSGPPLVVGMKMILRTVRVGACVAAMLGALLAPVVAGVSAAHASPVDDAKAQAARLQAQIDSNGVKQDALSERLNGANYRLQQAQADAATAQKGLDAAQARTKQLQHQLAQRAAAVYRGSGNGGLDTLDASTAGELQTREQYSAAAANHDDSIVSQLRDAKEQLQAKRSEAQKTADAAQSERDQAASAKKELDGASAKQKQLLSQVNGQIKQLIDQQRAAQAAASLAAAQARTSAARTSAARTSPAKSSHAALQGRVSTGGDIQINLGSIPAPSGGAGAAIAFAYAQLGKPYVYGAAGPDSYDCSGLTMRAWGAAGVSMPHYSGAQYSAFPHVPLSAMQPGDLVFWGPGGSSHVGLYIGGGMMIAAPHTGDHVRVQAVYGGAIGASRPG
jgi:peptidoglycan DL-endopeptidase CwlO